MFEIYKNYKVRSIVVNIMSGSKNTYCLCRLNGIMDTLGKKWAIFVLNSVGNHKTVRYNQLYKELHGISPSTLAKILKELNDMGILKKEVFPEVPPRVEYSLTDTGKDLRSSIMPLLMWAAKYESNKEDPGYCDQNQYVAIEP